MIRVSHIYHCERCVTNESWELPSAIFVCRLYYVNSGSAVVQLENRQYHLTAGKLYLMPQTDKFKRIQVNNFDFTCFDFSCTPLLQHDSFVELPFNFCGLNHFFEFINQSQKYVGYIKQSHVYKEGLTREIEKRLLDTILAIIATNIKLPFVQDVTVNRALEIIRKNLDTITSGSLAKELNVTEGYFIHLFNRTVGVPPMKYVRGLRLAEAENYLKMGMSVGETAEKCGYSNPNAFWKAIKREYGCTPTELKRK